MKKQYDENISRIATYVIILLSVWFSVFYFGSAIFGRFVQAVNDFIRSFGYYGTSIYGAEYIVAPTVAEIPTGITEVIPFDYNLFLDRLRRFGSNFFSIENVKAFFVRIAEILSPIAEKVVQLALPVSLLILAKMLIPAHTDNDYGKPTVFLRAFWKIQKWVINPVVDLICSISDYVKNHKLVKWALITVWLYNLNWATILIEFVAYFVYFSISRDFVHIYLQFAKLAIDMTVSVDFLPLFVWLILYYKVMDHFRRKKGYSFLEEREMINRQFLRDHPGNFLITGKPRWGKTRTMTDMAVSNEVEFREMAKEKMFFRHMEFPFFPWINVENTVKTLRESIWNFDLSILRGTLKRIFYLYRGRAILATKTVERELAKLHSLGYVGDNTLFGYDLKRYPTVYNNGISNVDITETITKYAEEYYIYTAPTSLIIGNYSIRSDIQWVDLGNFPFMCADFFRTSPEESKENTKFSHLLIYDCLRLGVKVDPNEAYQDSFELGCVTITEAGKEFGNRLTNEGMRADDEESNAKNDKFALSAKMISHGSTIDNETYVRILMDEQRAGSLQADIKDIGSTISIDEKGETEIILPHYTIGQALYAWLTNKFANFYENHRVRRGSITLRLYLFSWLYSIVYNHHTKISNTFGSYRLTLAILDNSISTQAVEKCEYYINLKKGDRYDCTSFADLYNTKWSRSKVGGINQIPTYSGVRPLMPEFRRLGSRFIRDIDPIFSELKGNF